MEQPRSIFFDLDGTLWPPQTVVLPAYRKVMDQLGLPTPADDVLMNTMGYPIHEIWQMLLPDCSEETRRKASELMATAESEMLASGVAAPFAGVSETLNRLYDAGIKLYILSNCEEQYLQEVPDALGIGRFFTGRYCAADFPGWTKAEILRSLLREAPMPAMMVGDRHHDIQAGVQNGLYTVACRYGFGAPEELAPAHWQIENFAEILFIIGLSPDGHHIFAQEG